MELEGGEAKRDPEKKWAREDSVCLKGTLPQGTFQHLEQLLPQTWAPLTPSWVTGR